MAQHEKFKFNHTFQGIEFANGICSFHCIFYTVFYLRKLFYHPVWVWECVMFVCDAVTMGTLPATTLPSTFCPSTFRPSTFRPSTPLIRLVSGAFHRSSFGPHSISFRLLAISFGPLAIYFDLYAVSLDVVDFSSDFFRLFLVNSLTPRVVSSAWRPPKLSDVIPFTWCLTVSLLPPFSLRSFC